jgi:hypothetical protein
MKSFCTYLVLLLPVLAGCAGPFENQCDQYSDRGEQLSCFDTAFLALESEIIEERGAREDTETWEYCEGLRERLADEDWAEENREEYGERLRECMVLWERLGDDRDCDARDEDEDDEWDEDEDDEWDEDEDDEWDEDEDDEWDEDEDGEWVEDEDGESDKDEDDVRLDDEDLRDDDDREAVREESCSRGGLGDLRQLRDRARGAIQRGEDSEDRGDQIREALREGRSWVDRILRVRDDRESTRDGEGERPR